MNTFIDLALIILIGSIIVFFAREIIDYFKKIFQYPGASVAVPLIIFSFLVIYFKDWISWFFISIRTQAIIFILKIMQLIPLPKINYIIAALIFYMLFTLIPVLIIQAVRLRTIKIPFQYTYILMPTLWIVCTMLLFA